MKICVVCKKEFPNTREFFHVHNFYSDGLTMTCKVCKRKKDRERYREKQIRKHAGRDEGINKDLKRSDRMPKKMQGKRPVQALDLRKIQAKKYKEGKTYEVSWKKDNRIDKPGSNVFKGKLLQETKDHITLINKRGLRESFLKVDFYLGTKIKELS